MSMIDKLESLLLNRTHSKPTQILKTRPRLSYNPTFSLHHMPKSFTQQSQSQKLIKRKNTVEKFYELRKKMVTKANQRIKNITMKAVKSQLNSRTSRLISSSDNIEVSCSKVVVHHDKSKQQKSWRKGLINNKSNRKFSNQIFMNNTQSSDILSQSKQKQFSYKQHIATRKFKYLKKKRNTAFPNSFGQQYFLNSTLCEWKKIQNKNSANFHKTRYQNRSSTSRDNIFKGNVQPWKTKYLFTQLQQF